MTFSNEAVAQWMKDQIDAGGFLYQDVAASEIGSKFGETFTPINENGNLSISPAVLRAFKKMTGSDVVWERGERVWRKRESYDLNGRQQP